MDKRVAERIGRLLKAHEMLSKRYVHFPDGPKKEALGRRLMELETSMKNLKEHGRERIAGSGKGVDIEVPVRNFSIRGEQ